MSKAKPKNLKRRWGTNEGGGWPCIGRGGWPGSSVRSSSFFGVALAHRLNECNARRGYLERPTLEASLIHQLMVHCGSHISSIVNVVKSSTYCKFQV